VAVGIEMLRQRIVELGGEPVEVAEEMPEEVSMTDFMALLNAFDREDQSTKEALYEAPVNPHGPKGSPTIH
jgi:hypothetical protein